jgi:hypothetical protein
MAGIDERVIAALHVARERVALDFDQLAAERARDVASWRRPALGTDPHRPEPWLDERAGSEGRWLADGEGKDQIDPKRVGFDAEGRAVLTGRGADVEEIWGHGDGWSERRTRRACSRTLFEVYREIAVALPDEQGDLHWVLGAATGVQGDPADPDTVPLLHLAYDETLDFRYLDGGVIQFRIARPALAARDWGAVVATADSC